MKINKCCFNLNGTERKACWEIESKCNLNCPFCFHAHQNSRFDSIEDINISSIIRQLHEQHIQNVILSGGEPLMCGSLFRIIEELESDNITVSICTNAILAKEYFCKKLMETAVRKVTINIADLPYLRNSTFSQMNDLCTQVIAGIRRFVKYGFDVTLSDIILNPNRDQFERRLVFCRENHVKKISFTIPVCKCMAYNQRPLSDEEIGKIIDILHFMEKLFPEIELTFNAPDCQSSDCPSQQFVFGIEGGEFLPSCLVKRDLKRFVN